MSSLKKKSLKSLIKKADKLYQVKLIKLRPMSIISGKPTEVIHHCVPKSQSNNLRYDPDNGIPLTCTEHARHHLSGDPAIVAVIVGALGQKWFRDIQKRRRIICRLNKKYLEEVIGRLEAL